MAPAEPPFPKEHQINVDLDIRQTQHGRIEVISATTGRAASLPGYPQIAIDDTITDFLDQELNTPELDSLSPRLWLVATQKSSHVSALHHQLVRGRAIVITEDPKLHLLWIESRVFVKPLPAYLLSHAFWTYILSEQSLSTTKESRELLSSSALGFLRSYTYLIKHESDFRLAKTYALIPSSITWEAWSRFRFSLHDVMDTDVSRRYLFGELRLSRLNFWSKIFLQRMHYFKSRGQTGTYLANFFAPFVYIWATINVVLAAMQLELTTQQVYGSSDTPSWEIFTSASRWASVAILVLAALAVLWIVLLVLTRYLEQLIFALKDLSRKRQKVEHDDERLK